MKKFLMALYFTMALLFSPMATAQSPQPQVDDIYMPFYLCSDAEDLKELINMSKVSKSANVGQQAFEDLVAGEKCFIFGGKFPSKVLEVVQRTEVNTTDHGPMVLHLLYVLMVTPAGASTGYLVVATQDTQA